MKLGHSGEKLIKSYETGPDGDGPALESYVCPAGVWTIGWGHTRGVGPGQHATLAQCDQWFDEDTDWAERVVNDQVFKPLTQNQFDACVSLAFNIGPKAFIGSTLLRKLNAGDYTGAANEFPRWNKSRGNILNGLVARRADEKTLFLTGIGD